MNYQLLPIERMIRCKGHNRHTLDTMIIHLIKAQKGMERNINDEIIIDITKITIPIMTRTMINDAVMAY